MSLIITAFIMVVALGVATILRLEKEGRKAQFVRNINRPNRQFSR